MSKKFPNNATDFHQPMTCFMQVMLLLHLAKHMTQQMRYQYSIIFRWSFLARGGQQIERCDETFSVSIASTHIKCFIECHLTCHFLIALHCRQNYSTLGIISQAIFPLATLDTMLQRVNIAQDMATNGAFHTVNRSALPLYWASL